MSQQPKFNGNSSKRTGSDAVAGRDVPITVLGLPFSLKPVYQYTLNGELVKIWNNQHDVKSLGFSQSCVNRCCLGLQKKHRGYLWSKEPINV